MVKFLLFLFLGFKALYAQDLPKKIFYIDATIEIDKGMSWSEIGVTNEKKFIEVIQESWKTWAETHFKKFDQVEIGIPSKDALFVHNESNVLKWTSMIKKIGDENMELSAQYILLSPKHNDVLLAFSFPTQTLVIDPSDKKETSSKVASLIYNLLNSQTGKIAAIHNTAKIVDEETSVLIKFKGALSLSEMLVVNSILQEKFKDLRLSSELRSFSVTEASLFIRAKTSEEKLLSAFTNAGKFPLNEQKLLLFNPSDKDFAILLKEQNN